MKGGREEDEVYMQQTQRQAMEQAQVLEVETVRRVFGAVGAFMAGVMGLLGPVFGGLMLLMSLDLVSGLMAAFVNGEVSSQVTWRGLVRKAMTVAVVLAVAAFEPVAGAFSPGVTLPVNVSPAAAVAAWFCAGELVSILENAKRAGISGPAWLGELLDRVQVQGGGVRG